MDDELTRLAKGGPNPARKLRHLVMTRFADMTTARQSARTWREIAQAIGFAGHEKAIASAYWRVKRGIEAGRLAVPQTAKPAGGQRSPAQPTTAGLPPLPGTEEKPEPPARAGFKRINLD